MAEGHLESAKGWVARRVGRVGTSRLELLVLAIDLTVMTVALTAPNPFADSKWPSAMTYEFGNFIYVFIILAGGTLAYSWRTIIAIGHWTAFLWMSGVGLVWYFGKTYPELSEAAETAFGFDPNLLQLMDPNNLDFDIRMQIGAGALQSMTENGMSATRNWPQPSTAAIRKA